MLSREINYYDKQILTVGKLKENSLESVMIRIGGATRFLTDRIMTKGMKQIIEITIAT